MNNKVDLTDDELSVIMASLQLSIQTYNNYQDKNVLDQYTRQGFEEMKTLYDKLKKEYF